MDLNQHLYKNTNCYDLRNCQATLKNEELWQKFHELDTEMIITKSGRRMFPALNVQLYNLDPHAHYCIMLEIDLVSKNKYKYSASAGWTPSGTEEVHSPRKIYYHPESPATGDYWMSQPISFGRMKLTNTLAAPLGHVVLSSMHLYQPRIIISQTTNSSEITLSPTFIVSFENTKFIAVTAYQNERITKLKIDNNPFAKGFRENGQSKCKRKRVSSEDKASNEPPVKRPNVNTKAPSSDKSERVCPSSSPSSRESSSSGSPCFASGIARLNFNTDYSSVYNTLSPLYYYPPYPMCVTSAMRGSPLYFNQPPLLPPLAAEDLRVHQPIKQQPKRKTSFSIRSILGIT